ncbi:MAG TPA: bifunctional phosphoribosylaminoimidazolecarboxamide formyltransferase/IMP cyclohydrolase, partial [Thermoanaerobaculia bacterium]|nr:bifunctional phosphoribosylaminoimidazolecarboxamide formyltransferase/IMP cyclohydrolase [Thermoanaerobaculia bacterium]
MRIERAILSVSDKSGIVELAKALTGRGVEILSTGGTAKHLSDAGIPVTSIASWSGAPEILGGRVKTLTPKVFGAILHDRANASHVADVEKLSIPAVDLVVVNLYPFEQTIAKEGATMVEAIENIDIGGPSMLRAAAKNYKHVLPLCSPSLYGDFIREFERGEISDDFRLRCATAVFELTNHYDRAIARFLRGGSEVPLRYGENPHQTAKFATDHPLRQLQGKELSFNNLLDLDAAMKLANAFAEPAIAIIKHTNPCGVARRKTSLDALRAAIESDPVSAFGGIIGSNREFDNDCARVIADMFLEVIVAPSFSAGAREVLAKKKNLRLIAASNIRSEWDIRSAAGGLPIQTPDRVSGRENWRVATQKQPTPAEMDGLEFAWIVCAHVKSNAIVLTSESQSIGVGAGQMSRVDAAKVAIMKSILPTAGAFAASDAFFPFRDGLDILADA